MGKKACLFSGMTGIVNFEGKPAAGVRLLRKIEGKDVDETVTDENGYFAFTPVYQKKSLFDFLPTEFVIQQEITAFRNGKEYEMWSGVKRNKEENAESRGKPLVVTCELSLKTRNYLTVNNSPIFSLYRWDVESDPNDEFSNPFDDSLEIP